MENFIYLWCIRSRIRFISRDLFRDRCRAYLLSDRYWANYCYGYSILQTNLCLLFDYLEWIDFLITHSFCFLCNSYFCVKHKCFGFSTRQNTAIDKNRYNWIGKSYLSLCCAKEGEKKRFLAESYANSALLYFYFNSKIVN